MSELQYTRKISLVVADNAGSGLDLSGLRISFAASKTDTQTPNKAMIRIYNLALDTANQIQKEFTRVVLQAGYESNYGVIFAGTIKQVYLGRENGTDDYLDISAGDGDEGYNFGVVNKTLAAGSTQSQQAETAVSAMPGVSLGHMDDMGGTKLPRGKVMFGMARNYLRQSSTASASSWSIQDGKVQIISATSYLPGTAVVLNSKTGLIGQPEQTNDGIKARCLLNPKIKVGCRVQIDQKSIAAARLPDTISTAPVNAAPAIQSDGFYRVLAVDYTGDTRGNDWYTDITCIGIDATAPTGREASTDGSA